MEASQQQTQGPTSRDVTTVPLGTLGTTRLLFSQKQAGGPSWLPDSAGSCGDNNAFAGSAYVSGPSLDRPRTSRSPPHFTAGETEAEPRAEAMPWATAE